MLKARDTVKAVCEAFGHPGWVRRVMSPTRGRPEIAWLRQLAMHVHRSLPNQSNASVARAFDRDRTTVRHACQRVNEQLRAECDEDGSQLFSNLNSAMARLRQPRT